MYCFRLLIDGVQHFLLLISSFFSLNPPIGIVNSVAIFYILVSLRFLYSHICFSISIIIHELTSIDVHCDLLSLLSILIRYFVDINRSHLGKFLSIPHVGISFILIGYTFLFFNFSNFRYFLLLHHRVCLNITFPCHFVIFLLQSSPFLKLICFILFIKIYGFLHSGSCMLICTFNLLLLSVCFFFQFPPWGFFLYYFFNISMIFSLFRSLKPTIAYHTIMNNVLIDCLFSACITFTFLLSLFVHCVFLNVYKNSPRSFHVPHLNFMLPFSYILHFISMPSFTCAVMADMSRYSFYTVIFFLSTLCAIRHWYPLVSFIFCISIWFLLCFHLFSLSYVSFLVLHVTFPIREVAVLLRWSHRSVCCFRPSFNTFIFHMLLFYGLSACNFSLIPLSFARLVCINFLVPTSLFPLACNPYSLCVPLLCLLLSFILLYVFFFNFLSCLVFLFVGMIVDVFLLLIKFSYTFSIFLFLFWAFLLSLFSTLFTLFLFSYYNWFVSSLDYFISSNTLTISNYSTLIYFILSYYRCIFLLPTTPFLVQLIEPFLGELLRSPSGGNNLFPLQFSQFFN